MSVSVDPALEALARAGLEEIAAGSGVGPAAGALASLAEQVHAWSARVDLTAHRSAEAILRRLVLDAAALAAVLPAADRVVDLGSGAGFPGLPIAILQPERSLLLVEARERAHHFQRAAVRKLGLANVELRRGRAEDLDPEPADLVLAQAMGPPAQVVRWMVRWVRTGGWIALPCAERVPSGLESAVELVASEVRPYVVPLRGPRRLLWLGRIPEQE